jgi:hypothetical protein
LRVGKGTNQHDDGTRHTVSNYRSRDFHMTFLTREFPRSAAARINNTQNTLPLRTRHSFAATVNLHLPSASWLVWRPAANPIVLNGCDQLTNSSTQYATLYSRPFRRRPTRMRTVAAIITTPTLTKPIVTIRSCHGAAFRPGAEMGRPAL